MANEKTQERLLAQRNGNKKPAFVVKESAFKPSVKARWRKPTGKHSPVRQYHKGRVKMPTVGYGAPKAVKGLNSAGLKPVLVYRAKDLDSVDSNKDVVIIASNVGLRKKLALLKICQEKGFVVSSVKDVSQKVADYEKQFNSRKQANSDKKSAKLNKKKETAKKVEEKKGADKKAADESKKETAKATETKDAEVKAKN